MKDTAKIKRITAVLLALLAAAAMVHTLFTGLEIDEEYALSLGFRLVRGDRLFATMWEPHQLSALPGALLVGLWLAVTGSSTGVMLFARAVMLVCKAALGVWLYRSLREVLGKTTAYLLALGTFLYTPKWFLAPDYTAQQFTFALAAFLCLYSYYAPGAKQHRGLWRVALGAVLACFSFLAYPQSIVAAPVYLVGLVLLGRKTDDKMHGAVTFIAVCAACGGAFVVYVLQGLGFDFAALLAQANLILNDPQYDFTTGERLAVLAGQAAQVLQTCWVPGLAAVALAAAEMIFGERRGLARWVENALWYFTILLTLWCTAYSLHTVSFDFRHMYLAATLAGGWTFWCDRHQEAGRGVRRVLFWLGWLPGVAAYLFILRSTLIPLNTTFMYLFLPAVWGMAALALKRPARQLRRAECAALLGVMVLALALPRLYLVQETGWRCQTVRDVELESITTGPAAGIRADKKAADMQQCLYEALAPYRGKAVLQAIGEQHGLGFLMADGTLTVAQASVISGTDSDPRFERYYENFPGKLPDVILYDTAEVRDMAAFHEWIEENFTIAERYSVTYGTAEVEVLVRG